MSGLPVGEPRVRAEDRPFWEAAARGELCLPRCDDCGLWIYYPRRYCPACHSARTTWTRASGRGVVYSYTVTRRIPGRWSRVVPFVLAYVELEEGPRLLTNVVDCDPETLSIGTPVVAVYDETEGGSAIVRFKPAADHSGG